MSVVAKGLDGREVGVGPGDIVLDEDAAPSPAKRGHSHPTFRPMYCGHAMMQTAGWIKMPLGTVVGLNPGHIVVDGDPAPPRKGHSSLPTFRPMRIVAKQLHKSRCHLVRR